MKRKSPKYELLENWFIKRSEKEVFSDCKNLNTSGYHVVLGDLHHKFYIIFMSYHHGSMVIVVVLPPVIDAFSTPATPNKKLLKNSAATTS